MERYWVIKGGGVRQINIGEKNTVVPYKRVAGRKDYLSTPFLPPFPHFFESCVRFPTPPFYESWAKIVPNNRVLVHWQYASKTHTWNSTSGEKGNIKCASWTHALASVSFSMATYTSAVTKHIICLQIVKWNKLIKHFPEWLNRNELD